MCAFEFWLIKKINDVTAASFIEKKKRSTVTTTVLIRLSWNLVCVYFGELLGLGLKFSVLRHRLLEKYDCEKNFKTGNDVKPITKYRFVLILAR